MSSEKNGGLSELVNLLRGDNLKRCGFAAGGMIALLAATVGVATVKHTYFENSQPTSTPFATIERPDGLRAYSSCAEEGQMADTTFEWLSSNNADHYRVFVEEEPLWRMGSIVRNCSQLCQDTFYALPPDKILGFVVVAYQNKEEVPKSGSPSDVAFFRTPSCASEGN